MNFDSTADFDVKLVTACRLANLDGVASLKRNFRFV